ncbi:Octanoyltransferase [Marinobacterium sp. xm-d-509]|nr:Octanoyltransferase [Marinobacterium sp. xm-g-48]NRP83196.1 Octanoyltransferase [Marinobacterium sp. xm-d-509]
MVSDLPLNVRYLGRQPYLEAFDRMQAFTNERTADTADELWVLEHEPVFTQGQAGKAEHLLGTGDIPVVQVDRGGQVTYHGPGQLVIYLLLDLKRNKLGVRDLVTLMEDSVVSLLADYRVIAAAKPDAPGVYVDGDKICSLGLRVRKSRSFHGLALNIDMDLEPFLRINPCGYAGLQMTQLSSFDPSATKVEKVGSELVQYLANAIGYAEWHTIHGWDSE